MSVFQALADSRSARTISGVPPGLLPWLMADLARSAFARGGRAVLIAADEAAARAVADSAAVFAPELEILVLPAWDCLPYDRAAPGHATVAERMATLSAIAEPPGAPGLLVTTVAAATQRLLARGVVAGHARTIEVGAGLTLEGLVGLLAKTGHVRADTVRESGEFAVRGGLVDVMPAGEEVVLRLDFFGDELEAIREVDPVSQRTVGRRSRLRLLPASEVLLDEARIRRFRQGFLEAFGAGAATDPLYQAVSDGRRPGGAEHFLPLFEERLETLFDWLGTHDIVVREAGADGAAAARFEAISDYHANRVAALHDDKARRKFGAAVYRPLAPEALYLAREAWDAALAARPVHVTSPSRARTPTPKRSISAAGRPATSQPIARPPKQPAPACTPRLPDALPPPAPRTAALSWPPQARAAATG